MKKQICFVFLSCFLGNAYGQEVYNVQLRCNKKERQVVTIARGIQDYVLKLIPPVGYEIEDSGIRSQIHDFWHKASLDEFDLFLGFSSREYVSIGGKLKPPPSEKHGSPPWFAVEVPSVDIDWAGYTAMQDEEGEDERIVQCPLRSESQPGKAIYLSVRGENLTPHNSVKVILIWDDPSLRILDESGNPVGNGVEFPIGLTGKTLYADPSADTGVFSITFQGPEGKTGRATDRVYGCVNPGILTRTVAEEPANVTRKILGVGEEVDLWLYGVSGQINWSADIGELEQIIGSKIRYTAPKQACTAHLTAACGNQAFNIVFMVIQPASIVFRYKPGGYIIFPQTPTQNNPYYAFEYEANVYLTPDTVNFHKLFLFEGASPPLGISGAYLNIPSKAKGHDEWSKARRMTSHVVSGFGTQWECPDGLRGASQDRPFTSGGFYWLNTWYYLMGEDKSLPKIQIETVKQAFDFEAYSINWGRFTISKGSGFGHSEAYIENDDTTVHVVR
ncbi:MAG: hypothetical protein IJR99_11100 [Kiritimatiellae bacterium]|nr:hypothetical protein [Kiritimatiellia bacterium]